MRKKNFIEQMLCLLLLLGTGTHIYAQNSSGFIPTDFQGYYFHRRISGFLHRKQQNSYNMATLV